MDLKTYLVVFTLVITFTEGILGTDEKQLHFMHTRGCGKRSLEYEGQDAPDMTVKRGIFWNISKMMKHFDQSSQRNKGPIQTDLKNPENVQAMLDNVFGQKCGNFYSKYRMGCIFSGI
jgi:hypothetical protein